MLQRRFRSKKKSICFPSKWRINMPRRPFAFWHNLVFNDDTGVHISSDGIVQFFREMFRNFLKINTKNMSSDERSLRFWVTIQTDGAKMLFRCQNKLSVVVYLEILENYEENKCIFRTLPFKKILFPCIN